MDRRLQEIEQEIKRDKEQHQQSEMRSLITELQQQRKSVTPVHHEEDKIYQARLLLAESNKQMVRHSLNEDNISRLFLVRISIAEHQTTAGRK